MCDTTSAPRTARRNCCASAPSATREAVSRAEARSSTGRASSKPYFWMPARSACPGRGRVSGALRARLARISGSTGSADMICSHFGHSVLPISMATGPPSVRPCRTPPRSDRVLLELHPRAASVSEPAPGQLLPDDRTRHGNAGGHPLEHRDERSPVRLPRRDPPQHDRHPPTPCAGASLTEGDGPVRAREQVASPARRPASRGDPDARRTAPTPTPGRALRLPRADFRSRGTRPDQARGKPGHGPRILAVDVEVPQQLEGAPIVQRGPRSGEPPPNPEVVVAPREISEHQRNEVQAFRHLLRRLARAGVIRRTEDALIPSDAATSSAPSASNTGPHRTTPMVGMLSVRLPGASREQTAASVEPQCAASQAP